MTKLNLYGNGLLGPIKPISRGLVSDKFIVPPFSILNSAKGFWQIRKKKWVGLGIKSEIGRLNRTQEMDKSPRDDYQRLQINSSIGAGVEGGVSIFDPVLTELMYKWFCLPNGQIIDPFAGGSVRGIVASLLNFNYWGCDLRQEQINANIVQAKDICKNSQPNWVFGDSLSKIKNAPTADFILSCPPYGNLEKYSDHPKDLSNMSYTDFIICYNKIIAKSCKKLKNNRFACFVVGDFRDKNGFYRNFVCETITAFKKQKLELYNEAIFITTPGSASMRVTRQFNVSRKMAKTHQNVLVFVKGDPRKRQI